MHEHHICLPEGFEASEIAEARRLNLVASFARSPDLERQPGLTALLSCSPEEPCGREGCPVCLRTFRYQLLSEAYRLRLNRAVWTRASIVPAGWLMPPGRLDDFDLEKAVLLIRKWLERSEICDLIVVGGIDVSFNTFGNKPLGWQFHLYLLINSRKSETLRQAIKASFKLDPNVHRPLTLGRVHPADLAKTLTYSYKSLFKQSSGYLEKERKKADGSPRKNSDPLPLTLGQLRELLGWLARHPIGSRLIMRNARRTTPPSEKMRIRLKVQPRLLSSSAKRKRRPRRAGNARRRAGKQV